MSITYYLLTRGILFSTFASTYLSIKSVNPMEWSRQLVSSGMESPVGVKGRKWQAADDSVIKKKYER